MEIRKSTLNDIEEILHVFDIAREYMISQGNASQWGDGYPGEEILKEDISNKNNYVILDNGLIVGTFSFITGDDPTYRIIKNGAWRYDHTYGTIHRLASTGITRGIARTCFEFCSKQSDYLRIDTHKDNHTMRTAITKYGFQECGIIFVRDGSERIAYDYLKKEVD